MNDNYFVLKIISRICIAIVAITVIVAGCQIYETRKFVEGGYTSGTVQGRGDIVWLKPDQCTPDKVQ